jgi:hypothetical protein
METLNYGLLKEVQRGLTTQKRAFVPMPGGQAEPVAGSSPMTAGLASGGMGAPQGGDPNAQQGGQPPQGDPNAQGGGMPSVDPNTGMPIDPGTGMLVDPSSGMLIDPQSGQQIDPSTMQPAGQGGQPQGGAEGEKAAPQPGQLGMEIEAIKTVVEQTVRKVLSEELNSILKAVGGGGGKKSSGGSKPAGAEGAKPEAGAQGGQPQGPDKLDSLLQQTQRTNELLQSMLGGGQEQAGQPMQ